MLVAAWGGDKAGAAADLARGRCCSLVAGVFAAGPASTPAAPPSAACIVADGFAAFAKMLIYRRRRGRDADRRRAGSAATGDYRAEYPVLILLRRARHGDDGLGGRPADALCRARAAEPRRLCPRQLPCARDARSAEAGLKYFVLGALASRHPALRHHPALRLHRHHLLRAASPRRSATALSTGAAVRPGLRARRPRLQDQRGAVPHVDAGRLRRRADPGHRLLRLARPRSRRWRCWCASRSRRWARRSTHGARS